MAVISASPELQISSISSVFCSLNRISFFFSSSFFFFFFIPFNVLYQFSTM